MTDLADFLRARYTEDAQAVRANWHRDGITSERYHDTPIDPTRLLADLDAKLAIVDAYEQAAYTLSLSEPGTAPHDLMTGARNYMHLTLRHLARPFAGHADYQEDWAA